MASSRLIVRNLGQAVTDERLRSVFAPYGELTDARVIKTPLGKSRCFGFVGFRSDQDAEGARVALNKTYVGSSKIVVELALARKDGEGADKAGKCAKDPKGVKGAKGAKRVKTAVGAEGAALVGKPASADRGLLQLDFLDSYKKRSASQPWANGADSHVAAGAARPGGPGEDGHSEDDGDTGDGSGVGRGPSDAQVDSAGDRAASGAAFNQVLSDLDYLRTKQSAPSASSEKPSRPAKKLKPNAADKLAGDVDAEFTGRILVRNIPYAVHEDDVERLFSQHGAVSDVLIPLDDAKRQKGFAFVQMLLPEDAVSAITALNGTTFQGRLISALPATARVAAAERAESQAPATGKVASGTYKQLKDIERRRKAQETVGWNASHIRSDAVVDATAERLGVSKSAFLDREEGNMAVRLALGETQLIAENHSYFQREGVDLSALETNKSKTTATERSKTTIVIKNIPTASNVQELSELFGRHGPLVRLLLPPSRTVALVEFVEAADARRSFKGLAYKKYQNVPLYLEWAPLHALSATPAAKAVVSQVTAISAADESDDEGGGGQDRSLFVKNLDFSTDEGRLKATFERAGVVRAVSIPRKKGATALTSSGFGFVEFASAGAMELALRELQGVVLDGRTLDIKRSEKRLVVKAKGASRKAKADNRSNMLVRNVAFQASAAELRELFANFGSLKSLRMPKKFDGSHRGFAFVSFANAHEAQEAMQRLGATHLYGRRLVLEWVDEGASEKDIGVLRSHAEKDAKLNGVAAKRKRGGASLEDLLAERPAEDEDD